MRQCSLVLTFVYLGIAAAAHAQASDPAQSAPSSTANPEVPQRYVEFTFGPTFGHKSGGMFGGEASMPYKHIQFFLEGGHMTNTATADLQNAANTIARVLSAAGTSTVKVKQPVNFIAVGGRYELPLEGRLHPYALVGVGVAKVKKDVNFFVNGADVTSQLLNVYGIQLGRDLAGSQTKALLEAGIGAHITLNSRFLGDRWFGDASYRYGRVFLEGQGLNTNRIQFGIGATF
jgi:opacity protein-like surface antigen